MKNRKIIFLLIIAILLIGCSEKNEKKEPIQLIEVSSEGSTIYQNDNIKIKISDNIDEKENIYTFILNELQKIDEFSPIGNLEIQISKQYMVPNVDKIIKCDTKFIETEEFKKEIIKKSYGIYDNWISEGLYAEIYNIEKKEVDFSTYYSNNDFSLFGARFFEPFSSKEEIENIQAVSIDLVEYLIKKGKKEELLKNQVEISDIEEWAKDKNIDLSYQRSIESLMNRMEVSKIKPNIYLTINTKEDINGFIIDILAMDERYKTPKKIEDFILMMDANVKNIKEGIKKDAPNFYNDYRIAIDNVPKIHYHLDINANIDFAEMGQGRIVLKNLSAQSHEYSHILIVDSFLNNNIVVNKPIWLDEGMANYLDIVYSESFKFSIEGILRLILDAKENEDKLSEEEKILADKWYKLFKANNIELNNLIENKNEKIKLHTIITDLSKFEYSGAFQKGAVFLKGQERINQKLWPMGKGNYIDYHSNQSFTNSLIHEYGLEELLYLMVEDFNTLTYEEYFGKSYEELKDDWIEYLKENKLSN